MARGARGAAWRIEHDGRRVRAVRPDGVPTVWADGSIRAQPVGAALLSLDGIALSRRARVRRRGQRPRRDQRAFDRGLSAWRRARSRWATRPPGDSAAVQAQAVTARSYAYIHLTPARAVRRDGRRARSALRRRRRRNAVGSQAVESTRWLVLTFAGRVVNAPYHSACGGSTAAASEIWRTSDEPYLRRGERPHSRNGSLLLRPRAAIHVDADARCADAERGDRAVSGGVRERARDEAGHGARRDDRVAHAVGARRDAHDHDRSRELRAAWQRHSLRAAQTRWRDSRKHVFFRRNERRRPTARSRVSRSTGWAMGMVSACVSGARSAARAPARIFARFFGRTIRAPRSGRRP